MSGTEGLRALLLAAGHGTRLRPITDHIPKCLVPIRGRPLLAFWLDTLFAEPRIERVLINTHYLAASVEEFVASSPWRDRIDLAHEPELLGSGGTILANRDYFAGRPFFVAHADNLTDADVGPLIDAHRAAAGEVLLTLLSFRTRTPQSCGILELDGRQRVIAFHEKVADPPGNLANGAVYIFAPEVIDRIAAIGRPWVDLSTEIIPALVPRIRAIEHTGFFIDIGTPEALTFACASFPRQP
jgi:Nucleoside-diphosphate-sugar pyrophosphorylase involved in lipopolysaccharide biosynthesis/translation initiation factor 2B, gamma/epsilon subunits (eIF-2Bgamma/eIF-2Bepsilon)